MHLKTALAFILCTAIMIGSFFALEQMQNFDSVKKESYKAKPIYIRIAAIYTGPINKQWQVTTKLLKKYGHTYIGRKMLLNHEWGDPMVAVGTIIATKVKYDPYYKKNYLEVIVRIDDPVAINKIKKELFYFISIGFTYTQAKNSIDGQKWRAGDYWNYIPGQVYTITRTTYKSSGLFQWTPAQVNIKVRAIAIIEDMEGQEISFVNVPASRYARVLEYSEKKLTIN